MWHLASYHNTITADQCGAPRSMELNSEVAHGQRVGKIQGVGGEKKVKNSG